MKINIKQVSDIHFNKPFRYEKLKLIEKKLCDSKTDYIIFTGDIIDSTKVIKDPILREIVLDWFKKLALKRKIIIELGNHDILKTYDNKDNWHDDFSFWENISEIKNIYFLPKCMCYKDENIYITGINPPFYYYETFDYDDSKQMLIDVIKKDINLFNNIDSKKFNIFISHSPIHMSDYDVLNYTNKFDVVLSGHMHNGLVFRFMENIFPENKGIIGPLRNLFPDNARGIKNITYNGHKTKLIINGGITKFAFSHGFLYKINRLYKSVIEEIIYDTDTKKIDVRKIYF